MDNMDSYMTDIDDMLDKLEAEEVSPSSSDEKRESKVRVEEVILIDVPKDHPSDAQVDAVNEKNGLINSDLAEIAPEEIFVSQNREHIHDERNNSVKEAFYTNEESLLLPHHTVLPDVDKLMSFAKSFVPGVELKQTGFPSTETEYTASSMPPFQTENQDEPLTLIDDVSTASETEVAGLLLSDSAYQSGDGASSTDSSPQKDVYSPSELLGKDIQYEASDDENDLNIGVDSTLQLLSSDVELPRTTSIKTPVSFQPAEWRRRDDVSEAELDEFFTSISPQLQLDSAQDTPSGSDALVDSAVQYSSGSKDRLYEDIESSTADLTFDSSLRLSPPLELAPPIPMALIDVSEFMDTSLDDVRDLSFQPFIPQSTSVFPESSSDLSSTHHLSADTINDSLPMEESSTHLDGQPLSVEMAQEEMSQLNSSSDFLIAIEDGTVAENGEKLVDENSAPNLDANAIKAVIFSADNLGKIKPQWVPDELAPICMLCGIKFTVVKRRHHCRACGSVICAICGNYKARLDYLEQREDRICALCNETFLYRNGGGSRHDDSFESRNTPSPVVLSSLNPRVPPGVLRRQDQGSRREPRNVVFFDGIRPGGDLIESPFHGNPRRRAALMEARRQRRSPAPPPPRPTGAPKKPSTGHVAKLFVHRDVLPVMEITRDGHYVLDDQPDVQLLQKKFQTVPSESVDFCVSSCLRVTAKIVNLQCCMGETVWCFTTSGMRLVGQDEILIVLAKQEDDFLPPRDIFVHLSEIWLHAKQGSVIGNLGHSIIGLGGNDVGFLGNRNNAGFLFIRQTHQCLVNLNIPEAPYLFGVLMTRWEVPWAKLFPLRLMLRLGAEYRYYPCPLGSFRNRKPVFEEVGHTVMNLLCDFRNFQYHLPFIENADCCMEKGVITVRIARYRYDQIVKVCQSANEHVLPIGLSFSMRVDAHLVCVQNLENGQYETQAINIHEKGHHVTGTSFIIFNASLKSTEMNECRTSVVEDGIMVQISARGLEQLKAALKSAKNFAFKAQSTSAPKSEEGILSAQEEKNLVVIEWTDERKTCNAGVRSPIDGKEMTGIESRRVSLKHSMDFVNGNLSVRCTEVFLDDEKDPATACREELDLSRLAENLALATCSVLRMHLYDYRDSGITRIGLRVCLGPDIVEYEVGSKGERFLPPALMDFDDKIMPLINECARLWGMRPRLEMELLFRVFPQ